MAEDQVRLSTVTVDIRDACNLACRTCPRGLRVMKNSSYQMPVPVFKQVVKKLGSKGITRFQLYNWGEPFLVKNLDKYTKIVKSAGYKCELSSNLSFNNIPNLIKILKNVDFMFVSLSGFTQKIYSINHMGGNIENVKKNLEIIAQAKRNKEIQTTVRIKYFDFPYTREEWPLFEEYAATLGLDISLTPAGGNPQAVHRRIRPTLREYQGSRYTTDLQSELTPKVCQDMGKISMDPHCNVYACCGRINEEYNRVGNLFEDDFDVIQYLRYSHLICLHCTSYPRQAAGVPHPDLVNSINSGKKKAFLASKDMSWDKTYVRSLEEKPKTDVDPISWCADKMAFPD